MALLVAMMAMLLMTALGAALVLTTSSEAIIAGNFRNSREGLYAAEAVLERSLDDLQTLPGLEPGAGWVAAVGVHRRSARRLAHAVRRFRDRPRPGDQHGELPEDHGVQHD